jgi:hypothetical protein
MPCRTAEVATGQLETCCDNVRCAMQASLRPGLWHSRCVCESAQQSVLRWRSFLSLLRMICGNTAAFSRDRPFTSQEGLISLLGAERMRSHFVVTVAMGPALRAGTRSLRNSVQEMVEGRKCSDASRIWNRAFRRCVLLRVKECFRQFGYAEHVRDEFDIVCHRRKAEFSPCTGQPAHQQTRMPEDPVLDCWPSGKLVTRTN